MLSFIVFLLVAVVPFIIFGINAFTTMREERGIAAGIPKAKQAKEPRRKKTREARVRQRRSVYCGREFTHLALAILGSQDSCKRCTYLQEVPPAPDGGEDEGGSGDRDTDIDAAVRAAEAIIDQANQ